MYQKTTGVNAAMHELMVCFLMTLTYTNCAEMQIKDAYEKIAQCKSELNEAKCVRRNRQGSA